jgi:hypothetical protein
MTIINIENGMNEFNLVGDKDCTIFQFKNRSKILSWEMNWNSLMNYFVGSISSHPIFYYEAYGKLNDKLTKGEITQDNLEQLIRPLLNSFSNGEYKVKIFEEYEQFDLIKPGVSNIIKNGNEETMIGWWAGGYPPFLFAIQESTDVTTVEEYEARIKNGEKPQMILIKAVESCIHFILDGHHKLMAYMNLGMKPNCILISKIDNYKISHNLILESFEKLKTNESKHLIEQLKSHLNQINTDTNKP